MLQGSYGKGKVNFCKEYIEVYMKFSWPEYMSVYLSSLFLYRLSRSLLCTCITSEKETSKRALSL